MMYAYFYHGRMNANNDCILRLKIKIIFIIDIDYNNKMFIAMNSNLHSLFIRIFYVCVCVPETDQNEIWRWSNVIYEIDCGIWSNSKV